MTNQLAVWTSWQEPLLGTARFLRQVALDPALRSVPFDINKENLERAIRVISPGVALFRSIRYEIADEDLESGGLPSFDLLMRRGQEESTRLATGEYWDQVGRALTTLRMLAKGELPVPAALADAGALCYELGVYIENIRHRHLWRVDERS